MLKFATAFIAALVLLSLAVSFSEAAWPQARWKRPTAISEQGDRRYLMQKYMRKIVEDAKEEDPIPDDTPKRRRSRSYHFAYGPRGHGLYGPDEHHTMQNGIEVDTNGNVVEGSFYPEDHMLYHG